MILALFAADLSTAWDAHKLWIVPVLVSCVPIALFLLTRRATKKDAERATATQAELLYIGSAKDLITTLQEELRTRNVRIGALESEREQLRGALAEERQMFERVRQRHRDTLALLTTSGIVVPDELHL